MTTIALPAELSIARLDVLRAQIMAALSSSAGAGVAVDGSAVERIDTPTLQLLCAFVAADAPLRWLGRSAPLVKAAELLGVAAYLGLAA